MIEYLVALIVRFKYAAVYGALAAAGLGVPFPEEATIAISGYLVATNEMIFGVTILVCYAGVLSGDVITYCLGRWGGGWMLRSRFMRWVISRRRLAQVQFYYRRYGPRSLLVSRQTPGLRFPSFFTAGMLRMPFWKFLLYDSVAALISMPLVFLLAYYFGPIGLDYLIGVITYVREIVSLVVLALLGALLVGWLLFRTLRRHR